jgi:hypothetical protein
MDAEQTKGRVFASVEELEMLVRKFESCELPLEEFNHRAHLTVALWYLSRLPEQEALRRMRAGLLRFIGHYGETGYHETMTVFWVRAVRGFLDQSRMIVTLAETANRLAEARGDSRLIYDYYSRERLSSAEAREGWIEPDLKALDF